MCEEHYFNQKYLGEFLVHKSYDEYLKRWCAYREECELIERAGGKVTVLLLKKHMLISCDIEDERVYQRAKMDSLREKY